LFNPERSYLIFINQKHLRKRLLINIYLNGLKIIFNNNKKIEIILFIHFIYNMKVDMILIFSKLLFVFLIGHSRTIVGYEHLRNGHIRLLIFDPSTSKTEIEKFLKNPNEKAHLFRRSLQSFQKPVYQILVVRRLLTPDEREVNHFKENYKFYLILFFYRLQNTFILLKFHCRTHNS
jgi:hypothetical protein